MIWTLIGIIFFLIIILIACRIGITRHKNNEEIDNQPMIHASGIYSIVRKSPREFMGNCKPTTEDIRKYLTAKNEDYNGSPLSGKEKENLVAQWNTLLDENIVEIENGDGEGVEFYFYEISENDPVTEKYIKKGSFVTREEIHDYPQIIPPFHIGCTCRLRAHRGSENLRDTAELGIRPLFRGEKIPPLPDWRHIVKP
jgi:hypothetical protein